MRRNILLICIWVLAIVMAAVPASAGNWYFGGGVDVAGVESKQPFLTDQNGFGLILNGGYRFTENISLDVAISSSGAAPELRSNRRGRGDRYGRTGYRRIPQVTIDGGLDVGR